MSLCSVRSWCRSRKEGNFCPDGVRCRGCEEKEGGVRRRHRETML